MKRFRPTYDLEGDYLNASDLDAFLETEIDLAMYRGKETEMSGERVKYFSRAAALLEVRKLIRTMKEGAI
jgi:hypothetical protein